MSKKNQSKQVPQLSPENYIRLKVRKLPVFRCTINVDWEISKLATVSVARKHMNGNITFAIFLVDLFCLGIKDANYMFNVPDTEYDRLISNNNKVELMTISYEMAHNVVYAGFEYAKGLGFNPHKDFTVARYLLEEDTDEIELIDIECGKSGKPFYVKTDWHSDQEANRIISQLEHSVGKGNFDFILSEN